MWASAPLSFPTGSVSDHGSGFPQDIIDQLYSGQPMKGIGLENVHKRLKSIYGESNGLTIDSSPDGSRVSFLIPGTAQDLSDSNDTKEVTL